jgi:hypothetical protein
MISRTVMMVAHFKVYPTQFPMRDPKCLVSAFGTSEDVQAMHPENEIDDADIGTPLTPRMTRSRMHQLPVTSTRIPQRQHSHLCHHRHSLPFSTSLLRRSMPELELATSFLNHNVVFVLPLAHKQLACGPPEVDMIGIGTRVQHRTRNLSLFCGFVLLSV